MRGEPIDLHGALLRRIALPLLHRITGDLTERTAARLQPMISWPRHRIEEYRDARLREIVAHAYDTSRFHRRRLDALGIDPRSIRGVADLPRLPVLTKRDLRENIDEIVSDRFVPRPELRAYTGGSTDTPTMFYRDEDCLRVRRGFTSAFRREWLGWRPGDRVALVWGAAQDIPARRSLRSRLRAGVIDRTAYFPASVLGKSDLERIADGLARFRPHVIQAYPSALELVVRHMVRAGGPTISPRSIVLTAEPVHSAQRALLADVFGVEPFSFYGSREFGMAAVECTRRDGLHVNEFSVVIETLAGDRPARPGEPGRIVVTDLDNRAVPFLRYEIGDSATLREEPCSCGSALKSIASLFGRDTDVFVRPDGVFVPGVTLCAGVIVESDRIAQLQIVQHDIEEVVVRLVEGRRFEETDVEQLLARIRAFMGDSIRIVVERVDEIPREPSGKHRFCISSVGRKMLRGAPVES